MRLRLFYIASGPDQELTYLKKEVFGSSLAVRNECWINGRNFLVFTVQRSLDGSEWAWIRPREPHDQSDLLREGWRIMSLDPRWVFVACEKKLRREGAGKALWAKEGF